MPLLGAAKPVPEAVPPGPGHKVIGRGARIGRGNGILGSIVQQQREGSAMPGGGKKGEGLPDPVVGKVDLLG